MGMQLTVPQKKKLADLEARIDAFQVAYMDAGRALMVIRDEGLYTEVATTFEAYMKSRFGYSKSHGYRLIEAYDAVRDTQDILSPMGDKVLPSPATERVAREVAKAVSPEKRADLWLEANKDKKPENVTAAHVRKVRERMFPAEPSDNGEPEEEPEEEPELELWEQFAEKHTEALNHLKQAIAAINWIGKHDEDAAYLAPVMTRIRTDYKQLRGTITQNCPTGMKRGKIETKVMERR